MRKLLTVVIALMILINSVVFAREPVNVFITDISEKDGLVTVEVTNALATETVITMTAIKSEDGYTEDDRTYAFYQKTAAPLSAVKLPFVIPENKNGIEPYGTYRITVQNGNGERTVRNWTHTDYSYTDSIDYKFDYLAERGIIDRTNNDEYIVRHTFKLIMGPEPHDGRLFRELSRRTFLNYVCNMIGGYGFTGSYSPEAITIAEEAKLIESGRFDHYRPLVYEDAVVILMKALGYKEIGEQTQYLSVAEELGLLQDVTAGKGDRIKTFDAVTLLYNAEEIRNRQAAYATEPLFYNSLGQVRVISEQESGTVITAKATVANYTEDDFAESAILVVALYKDDMLVKLQRSEKIDIVKGAVINELTCDIEMPEYVSAAGYVLKAFL